MAINLIFTNRNTNAEGIRIYRSTNIFDKFSLPPVYDTIAGDAQEYTDINVIRGEEFYYMLEIFRGVDVDFTPVLHTKALATLTGPGPNVLIGGTSRAGFFGEVPVSQLITGDLLASTVGVTEGTSQFSSEPWLKFVLDGKILYVSKKPIRYSISWDHLNSKEVVFGNKTININGETFKVRLLQGINPSESVTNTNGYDLPITHRSEWNRLFYPICEDNATYPKTSQIGPNWVTYTQDELNITSGDGRYNWCQETPSNSSGVRANRGGNAVSFLRWGASSDANTNYGWRACLELVSN